LHGCDSVQGLSKIYVEVPPLDDASLSPSFIHKHAPICLCGFFGFAANKQLHMSTITVKKLNLTTPRPERPRFQVREFHFAGNVSNFPFDQGKTFDQVARVVLAKYTELWSAANYQDAMAYAMEFLLLPRSVRSFSGRHSDTPHADLLRKTVQNVLAMHYEQATSEIDNTQDMVKLRFGCPPGTRILGQGEECPKKIITYDYGTQGVKVRCCVDIESLAKGVVQDTEALLRILGDQRTISRAQKDEVERDIRLRYQLGAVEYATPFEEMNVRSVKTSNEDDGSTEKVVIPFTVAMFETAANAKAVQLSECEKIIQGSETDREKMIQLGKNLGVSTTTIGVVSSWRGDLQKGVAYLVSVDMSYITMAYNIGTVVLTAWCLSPMAWIDGLGLSASSWLSTLYTMARDMLVWVMPNVWSHAVENAKETALMFIYYMLQQSFVDKDEDGSEYVTSYMTKLIRMLLTIPMQIFHFGPDSIRLAAHYISRFTSMMSAVYMVYDLGSLIWGIGTVCGTMQVRAVSWMFGTTMRALSGAIQWMVQLACSFFFGKGSKMCVKLDEWGQYLSGVTISTAMRSLRDTIRADGGKFGQELVTYLPDQLEIALAAATLREYELTPSISERPTGGGWKQFYRDHHPDKHQEDDKAKHSAIMVKANHSNEVLRKYGIKHSARTQNDMNDLITRLENSAMNLATDVEEGVRERMNNAWVHVRGILFETKVPEDQQDATGTKGTTSEQEASPSSGETPPKAETVYGTDKIITLEEVDDSVLKPDINSAGVHKTLGVLQTRSKGKYLYVAVFANDGKKKMVKGWEPVAPEDAGLDPNDGNAEQASISSKYYYVFRKKNPQWKPPVKTPTPPPVKSSTHLPPKPPVDHARNTTHTPTPPTGFTRITATTFRSLPYFYRNRIARDYVNEGKVDFSHLYINDSNGGPAYWNTDVNEMQYLA